MKSLVRTFVLLVILGVVGFAGLLYLDQAVAPQVQPVEKTISHENFAG
ncbi:MAG: hypothetical protein RLN89_05680 [Parvibaculum sp.]